MAPLRRALSKFIATNQNTGCFGKFAVIYEGSAAHRKRVGSVLVRFVDFVVGGCRDAEMLAFRNSGVG